MIAKTNQVESWVARIAGLEANAIGLIQRGKRSPEMVVLLIDALQLFKENSLGDVCVDDIDSRRRRLRRKFCHDTCQRYTLSEGGVPIRVLGISRSTMASLFLYLPHSGFLKDMVVCDYDQLCSFVGVEVTDEIVDALEPYGLYLGMPENEIIEAFGEK